MPGITDEQSALIYEKLVTVIAGQFDSHIARKIDELVVKNQIADKNPEKYFRYKGKIYRQREQVRTYFHSVRSLSESLVPAMEEILKENEDFEQDFQYIRAFLADAISSASCIKDLERLLPTVLWNQLSDFKSDTAPSTMRDATVDLLSIKHKKGIMLLKKHLTLNLIRP